MNQETDSQETDSQEVGERKTLLYIIGPMTSTDSNPTVDFNYPAFHEAARRLREAGYTVINPAEIHEHIDPPTAVEGKNRRGEYLRTDIAALVTHCTGIAFLPNWCLSLGAFLEYRIATACGMEVASVQDWLEVARILAEEAD